MESYQNIGEIQNKRQTMRFSSLNPHFPNTSAHQEQVLSRLPSCSACWEFGSKKWNIFDSFWNSNLQVIQPQLFRNHDALKWRHSMIVLQKAHAGFDEKVNLVEKCQLQQPDNICGLK